MMTNNDIFKKLRVALMLRDDQIVEILELVDFKLLNQSWVLFSEMKNMKIIWNVTKCCAIS
jgi:uncharacterized protein YehS (DUF1456 family)